MFDTTDPNRLEPSPSAERSSKGADGVRDGAARRWRIGERIQHNEIMDCAIIPDGGDPNACVQQFPGVGFPFVTHSIILIDDHWRARARPELIERGAEGRAVCCARGGPQRIVSLFRGAGGRSRIGQSCCYLKESSNDRRVSQTDGQRKE